MSAAFIRTTILIIIVFLSGCAHFATRTIPSSDLQVSTRVRYLEGIPLYTQKDNMCGPASLAMTLSWAGETITPEALEGQIFTPGKKGSLQMDLIAGARRHGKLAYVIEPNLPALIREVEQGHPVIVLQNLGLKWAPVWHYAVVVGYNLDQNTIILHAGGDKPQELSLRTFQHTWARGQNWGLLVLPPGVLPANPEEIQYLKAAVGLEQAKQWQAAIASYQTALNTWPNNLTAQLGLGNIFYGMGKLREAQVILSEATIHHPTSVAALNNYAQVLAKQGQWKKALKPAREAVKLSNYTCQACVETLTEIESHLY